MDLEVGMYLRHEGLDGEFPIIQKITKIERPDKYKENCEVYTDKCGVWCIDSVNIKIDKSKYSFNLIDLVEYLDLLVIENPIKLYGKEGVEVSLFNPVRCDGFTEFEDGTHCIILNLDYLVDVKDLKIKKIITHEALDSYFYTVEE